MRRPLLYLATFGTLVGLSGRPAWAALESAVYQTVPGAMVEERGDRVPGGSRYVPFFATLTFDLIATEPSLTAVITNAVLEGGEPFVLTVRSSSGTQLVDGVIGEAQLDFQFGKAGFHGLGPVA